MSQSQLIDAAYNFKPVSDSEITQAKARRIEDVVGAVLALKRDFGLCPFHAEKSPSLHVDRKRNIFCCFGCGAKGDAITFVRRLRNLDFAAAVRELCGGPAPAPKLAGPSGSGFRPASRRPGQTDEKLPDPHILALWRSADALNIARWYLESRGLVLRGLPEALRGHREVWCAEVRQHRPAMLAAITDAAGRVTAVQRTWVSERLEYDGTTSFPKGARAPLSAAKKTWGPMGSGAVRLGLEGPVLGLAEGVESAVAAARLYGLPVWATCGAARLANIALPEMVERVVIFGDNGAAGEAAAAKAESAYRRRGYAAQVALPESAYSDFCDQVRAG